VREGVKADIELGIAHRTAWRRTAYVTLSPANPALDAGSYGCLCTFQPTHTGSHGCLCTFQRGGSLCGPSSERITA
jgi:hypothetical protein